MIPLIMRSLDLSTAESERVNDDVEDREETIRIMLGREETYLCNDYVLRRKLGIEKGEKACSMINSHVSSLFPGEKEGDFSKHSDDIRAGRKLMCEWSYRLVDHFKGTREIVEISMKYFDVYT